jgi:hypothetical protein
MEKGMGSACGPLTMAAMLCCVSLGQAACGASNRVQRVLEQSIVVHRRPHLPIGVPLKIADTISCTATACESHETDLPSHVERCHPGSVGLPIPEETTLRLSEAFREGRFRDEQLVRAAFRRAISAVPGRDKRTVFPFRYSHAWQEIHIVPRYECRSINLSTSPMGARTSCRAAGVESRPVIQRIVVENSVDDFAPLSKQSVLAFFEREGSSVASKKSHVFVSALEQSTRKRWSDASALFERAALLADKSGEGPLSSLVAWLNVAVSAVLAGDQARFSRGLGRFAGPVPGGRAIVMHQWIHALRMPGASKKDMQLANALSDLFPVLYRLMDIGEQSLILGPSPCDPGRR